MSRIVAILTGDLIGSTTATLEAVEVSMQIIAECAREIGKDTDFTRFRGDGWQIRLVEPQHSLWACLLILARLRAREDALGCRIAVGIGEEYLTDAKDLSTAMGPAFTASGRALDRMKSGRLLTLDYGRKDHPENRFRKLAFAIAGELAGRWTIGQAEAMALKLDSDCPADDRASNEMVAARIGVTRQAIDARLRAADYPILDEIVHAFLADSMTLHD